MNKIIFSEKSSLSLKNKSLATCQYAAVFSERDFAVSSFGYVLFNPAPCSGKSRTGSLPLLSIQTIITSFLPGQMHGVQDSPCPLIYQARSQIL